METANTEVEDDSPIIQTPLFHTDKRPYTLGDVLSFSEFLNLLDSPLAILKEGLAAQQYAGDRDHYLDPAALQTAANDWRYKFNLITVQETEEWLARFDVSLDDLNNFLSRNLWRSRCFGDSATAEMAKQPVPSTWIFETVWQELVFSNRLAEIVFQFIRRVIVKDYESAGNPLSPQELESAKHRFTTRKNIHNDSLQSHLNQSLFMGNNIEECLRMDGIYQRYLEQCATPERCDIVLKSNRSKMIRLNYESISFCSDQLAKEALLCVNEDGDNLLHVAETTSGVYSKSSELLENIAFNFQQKLFSASPNECVGPLIYSANDFRIIRILEKTNPSLNDPEIFEFLQEKYISELLDPLIERHICWGKYRLRYDLGRAQ